MKVYYVYMMCNQSRTLYTGVTGNLDHRVREHKQKLKTGFTSKYNITQLVWFESFTDVYQALEAEKRIKGWRRSKKLELIDRENPRWDDLAENW